MSVKPGVHGAQSRRHILRNWHNVIARLLWRN